MDINVRIRRSMKVKIAKRVVRLKIFSVENRYFLWKHLLKWKMMVFQINSGNSNQASGSGSNQAGGQETRIEILIGDTSLPSHMSVLQVNTRECFKNSDNFIPIFQSSMLVQR